MITTVVENRKREEKVKDGIDFLFSHFEGRQRLFPRKMSTLVSNGKQFIVYNKEQILNACIKSNFQDCRLNAYPVLEDGVLQAPNLIFIDLDLPTKYEDNLKELDKTLNKTLKIIKEKLKGGDQPTVLWSGKGYHIYIVLDIRPLELLEELRELSDKPSEQFLKFTESTFTNNKKDPQHKPYFQSCLLRIPGTFNSKNNLEVAIIQRYNVNDIPIIDNDKILREFRLYLANIDIAETNNKKGNAFMQNQYHSAIQYQWIEKLLCTPIEEGRKYTLWKILCPYLVNIKKLEYEESFKILKTWLEKCNNSRKLDFNPEIAIKAKLYCVKHYDPISIKTLMEDNKNLYLLLR